MKFIVLLYLACFAQPFGFALNNPIKSFGRLRHALPARKVSELIASRVDNVNNDEFDPSDDNVMSLPWGDFQSWALRDNVPNYVVSIPIKGAEKPLLYALWRTMSREVVELNGYPVEMLQEKYRELLLHGKSEGLPSQGLDVPGILPIIDEYEFKSSGGLSGRVYGIPGVADGSNIETTSVKEVQVTLPKGYVLTEDGGFAYELGTPMGETLNRQEFSYSLDGVARSARLATNMMDEFADGVAERTRRTPPSVTEDTTLLKLGASTAVLLAGSLAVNVLSHHLTVHMFWV